MGDEIDLAALSDAAFLAYIESVEVSPQAFDHAAHVRTAYLLLRDAGAFAPALQRMSYALKAITKKAGVPEKYHETITVAFMALVNERMADGAHCDTWEAFAKAHADLLLSNPLAKIYSAEELANPLARRVFMFPAAKAGNE